MIEINEMNIRVPGVAQSDAESLGKQIAENLSGEFSAGAWSKNAKMDELNVQIKIVSGMDYSGMARLISEKIIQELRGL